MCWSNKSVTALEERKEELERIIKDAQKELQEINLELLYRD